jgi:hypothetical protein
MEDVNLSQEVDTNYFTGAWETLIMVTRGKENHYIIDSPSATY